MLQWLRNIIGGKKQDAANLPPFWQEYLAATADQLPSATPLAATEFVVFDTETTGFDPKYDKVLSIGAVKVRGLQVLIADSFETLVQQEVSAGNKSPEIHGILPSQSQQGIAEQEALKAFLRFAGGAVLVGHHVQFDVEMMNRILQRLGIHDRLRNYTLDTAQLAMRLEQGSKQLSSTTSAGYSLDALVQKYNLPTEDRHTAPGDAFATAILLLKLLAQAQKRGITTLGELVR